MVLRDYPAPPNLRTLRGSFCLQDKVQLLCPTHIRPHLTCPALSIVPCLPINNLESCQIHLLSVCWTILLILSPPQPQERPPPVPHANYYPPLGNKAAPQTTRPRRVSLLWTSLVLLFAYFVANKCEIHFYCLRQGFSISALLTLWPK